MLQLDARTLVGYMRMYASCCEIMIRHNRLLLASMGSRSPFCVLPWLRWRYYNCKTTVGRDSQTHYCLVGVPKRSL